MTLTQWERDRIAQLLGLQNIYGYLPPDQAEELRRLLTKQYPEAANLNWEALIKLGLIALGAWLLFRKK